MYSYMSVWKNGNFRHLEKLCLPPNRAKYGIYYLKKTLTKHLAFR